MRIQHNIMAMSAYRNYTNNVSAMKKNLEKLSSGYKINRAGDDAAGLAISEKMRAQITGLETAQKNAKDGISLVQTAEGALTEVHDMLNRMVELATQSANGTYDNTTDRAQMQKEINQLRSEIDRIADSSNFNGIQLLDGSMSGAGVLGDPSNVDVSAVRDGDKIAGKTQKGEYSFDLGQLVAEGKLTTGGASITGSTIKIEVGDATLTTASLTEGDFSDGMLKMSALLAAITATDVTIAGYTFDVTKADSGEVTLKGHKAPTSADATSIATTAMTVALTFTDQNGNNNGWDMAVHIKEAVKYAAPQKLAQGKFDLTSVKDGTQITIGNETYTFKVGKNGSGSGGTVIDLTAYEETDADLLKNAAKALSVQANKQFDITADGKSATVYLTEKAGTVDYDKDWDLQGTTDASATSDASWKNTVTSESAVRIAQPGAATGKSLTLQIGDTADSFNQLKVNIGDMHCKSLGIDTTKMSIENQDDAAKAVDLIKAAINKVSDVRGTLGATQNRLDHTINNLGVMTENIQDAESTIRDVDVAEEMMAYTKNNILIQSAQAMLAQANQVPQGVLQLLQ